MKTLAPVLLALLFATACGKKEESSSGSSSSTPSWKASTPREFFDSCKACSESRDFESVWDKSMTKAAQTDAEKRVKQLQEMAKDKKMMERFKKEFNISDDFPTLSPKAAWIQVMKSEAEQDPEEMAWVSEEIQGETATIKYTETKKKKKKETDPDPKPKEKTMKLGKEDGMWKLAELPRD